MIVSGMKTTGPAKIPQDDRPQEGDRFLERMDRELSGWPDPVARLRQALKRDELLLFAQPIVSLRERGQIAMAETLVRLREEELALLPPGEFLPAFEHFRIMPELDRWVVRHVVAALASGCRVPQLGINISVQTLADAEFAAAVAEFLARAKVKPESLIFEIDENDLLGRRDETERFSAAAKAIGCKLLIDGFGRRSVSFQALKSLDVDFVKVDGVIVRKLATSDVARSKMNAIVRVGEVIGVGVIGECVEDAGTASALEAAGVGYAQGFGIGAPEPIEKFCTG